MDKGLGAVNWWGFSPSVDILSYLGHVRNIEDKNEVNILLAGAGDCRHVAKTVSQRMRHSKNSEEPISLHFYILESNLEQYARHMMLIAILLRSSGSMGLQERTELFAEIFANSLIRFQTAQFVQLMANQFIKMVTDFDYLENNLPVFDLSLLKYKERDMMEGIFKLWRKAEVEVFDVKQCWDSRVRQHLGSRYDSAKGAFDWDYSMKLCDRGAEIISSHNYQRWRKTGVAFQLREATYDVPNKTLASGLVFHVDGQRIGRRGYWGDIVVSPYISFGIECDEETMFKKANRDYVNSSEQITQHNLSSMTHELHTGEVYSLSKKDTIEEEPEEQNPETKDDGNSAVEEVEFIPCSGVKVSFLPLNSLPDMARKAKYEKLFDAVFIANSMTHHTVQPITDMFADEAVVVMETAKFITELSKEQYMQFGDKITAMAKGVGCKKLIDLDAEMDSLAFFKYLRTN